MLSQFLGGLRDPPCAEQINHATVDLDDNLLFRPLLDESTEFQRLGYLAHPETTHIEYLGNLRSLEQSIARNEFVHEYIPLGLFGGLIAEFR
jgi:hypothetical protein